MMPGSWDNLLAGEQFAGEERPEETAPPRDAADDGVGKKTAPTRDPADDGVGCGDRALRGGDGRRVSQRRRLNRLQVQLRLLHPRNHDGDGFQKKDPPAVLRPNIRRMIRSGKIIETRSSCS